MKMCNLMLLAMSVTSVTACSSTKPVVASYVNKEVPYLAKSNTKIQSDGASWVNSSAFRQVPKELQTIGNSVCQRYNFDAAVGYHPAARDLQGNPILGGGYLCGKINVL